ncbi:hypothetical protein ACFYT3_24840 [Nocardia amikacinitolerans]|uniref:hypothetical protein n=1 Tax=Nocardia amikacinitolerans TaxID=756689 RepID=UPI0020A2CB13|nr:hypothetical protein [Nocardia amikacinitolerans]MCP2292990.1 hypothetical protein [Nocardia amikacinitolerans]
MRTRFEFDLHTVASPEQVIELYTDFSAERPRRWPALSARQYRVFALGEHTADVLEGQDFPKISARWNYDWSTPGTIRMRVVDSDYLAPGSFHELTIRPAEDGGSDVHGVWDNTALRPSSQVGLAMARLMGRRFFVAYYTRVFDRLVEEKEE